ncbi:MAG: hypothetical protein H7332_04255 [Bdellovibrionales bacterium]|nr:hypothetical protein [Ramlibacter sp.]
MERTVTAATAASHSHQHAAGKTTLGLQFPLEAVGVGERALYVTLSGTLEELRTVAASHGWSLDGLQMHELLTYLIQRGVLSGGTSYKGSVPLVNASPSFSAPSHHA